MADFDFDTTPMLPMGSSQLDAGTGNYNSWNLAADFNDFDDDYAYGADQAKYYSNFNSLDNLKSLDKIGDFSKSMPEFGEMNNMNSAVEPMPSLGTTQLENAPVTGSAPMLGTRLNNRRNLLVPTDDDYRGTIAPKDIVTAEALNSSVAKLLADDQSVGGVGGGSGGGGGVVGQPSRIPELSTNKDLGLINEFKTPVTGTVGNKQLGGTIMSGGEGGVDDETPLLDSASSPKTITQTEFSTPAGFMQKGGKLKNMDEPVIAGGNGGDNGGNGSNDGGSTEALYDGGSKEALKKGESFDKRYAKGDDPRSWLARKAHWVSKHGAQFTAAGGFIANVVKDIIIDARDRKDRQEEAAAAAAKEDEKKKKRKNDDDEEDGGNKDVWRKYIATNSMKKQYTT